jgi:hypothetical protein
MKKFQDYPGRRSITLSDWISFFKQRGEYYQLSKKNLEITKGGVLPTFKKKIETSKGGSITNFQKKNLK